MDDTPPAARSGSGGCLPVTVPDLLQRDARLAGRRRWDPFAEFEDLYQRMGQLMDRAFDGLWQPSGQAWAPPADLTETSGAYVAEVELPGVRKDDIRVEVAGQDLVIGGQYRDTGTDGRALRRDRRTGVFEFRRPVPAPTVPPVPETGSSGRQSWRAWSSLCATGPGYGLVTVSGEVDIAVAGQLRGRRAGATPERA